MIRNDEPEAIVPDVEDGKSVNIVRIRKSSTQFLKIPPTRRLHNPLPGSDFLRCLAMILRRLLQAFDRDNMHCLSVLRNLRSVKWADASSKVLN
jgi:hypothetical protein